MPDSHKYAFAVYGLKLDLHSADVTESSLVSQIGKMLRRERELSGLTQKSLAERAGTSQAAVARIERGDRTPSFPLLERLFAALDLQLAISVEPLDAQLDAEMADQSAIPLNERIEDAAIDKVAATLADLPHVFDGAAAALLQGVPVPVRAVEVAIAWSDVDAFTAWLDKRFAKRWNEKWHEFGYVVVDPRAPGVHHWQTIEGEIRARMCDELPESIEVRHSDQGYRVVPLVNLEMDDPRTANLVRRYQERRSG